VSGRIVLVGTPIGNLGDLAPRAVSTLAEADLICCEDTRRTRKLLTHSGITKADLFALHEHNEVAAAPMIVARAQAGEVIAVVTDAGMPGISDPGERLVRQAIGAGVEVQAVPGPSAVSTAVVLSGLDCSRWCFEGFLPRKGSGRRNRLAELGSETRTSVLYEAPHRVRATVEDLAASCGDERRVAIARELTKLHEEVWRGTLADARAWLDTHEPRGEFVLVLAGAESPVPPSGPADIAEALRRRLSAGRDRKLAVAEVAAELSVPKRVVYQAALDLDGGQARH
jgi:16S rRNA (cytidine1402-2'-O)-methyltransferase